MTQGGRYLIAIGMPACPKIQALPALPLVERDVQLMADLLADQGYQRVLAEELGLGASSATMRQQLGAWFTDEARSEDDHVIVYFAGHGDIDGNSFSEHCLLTSDAEPYRMHTVFPTADFARIFFGGQAAPKNLLLILDTCFAGAGAAHTMLGALGKPIVPDGGAGFWVIAATRHNSLAIDGAFATAFHAALCDRQHMPEHRGAYLSPHDIVVAANRWFAQHHKPQRAAAALIGGATGTRFFENPAYWQLPDDALAEDLAFWQQAASGADLPGSSGRHFSGRRQAIAQVISWLADPSSAHAALLLTGMPGSGKSALFGQLLLEAAPHHDIDIDVALRATNESLDAFTQKLAIALRCAARTPRLLVAELNSSGRRATVLVDGLDEAREAERIELELLSALAGCPGIKLLVASRRFGARAPLERHALVLDLDAAPYFDVADLVDYVHARLRAGDRFTRYDGPVDDLHARAVATHLAQAAGTSFLYARVAARAVLALGHTIATQVAGWEARLPLPKDIDDAYAADFQRFDAVKRRCFLALLLPLAYAHGKGLPLGSLWLALANAGGGNPYAIDDLVALREEAGFYLIQDEQYGKPVYRLFHQTFVDYLKQRGAPAGADERYFAALNVYAHAAQAPLRFNAETEPYIRHHFAAHAAAARQLDTCLNDAAMLATIAPDDILPVLPMATSVRGRVLAAAYKRACHWIRLGQPRAFLCHFALASADYGAHDIMARLDTVDDELPWRPLAVLGSASSSAEVYASGGEIITALALATDRQGHTVAICGHASGSVAIRSLYNDTVLLDLAAPVPAQPAPDGLPARNGTGVTCIETLYRRGGLCIAVATASATLALYELSLDWTCNALSLVRDIGVRAMCFAERALGPALVTCGKNDISVWSLAGLQRLASQPNAAPGGIYGVACFRQDGIPMLAVVNDTWRAGKKVDEHILRLWRLEDLRLRRKIKHEDMSLGKRVYACLVDRRQLLLLADGAGNVLLVDPLTDMVHYHGARLRPSRTTEGLGEIHYSESTADGGRVVSCLYGRIETAVLLAAANAAEPPVINFVSQGQALGSDICRVTGDGTRIVAAVGTQLRVYRMDKSDQPSAEGSMDFAVSIAERRLSKSVCAGSRTFLGDHLGRVTCWRADGSLQWESQLPGPKVCGLALTADDTPALVAATHGGVLAVLDPESGRQRACLTLPGEITGLRLGQYRGLSVCFVILNSKFKGRNHCAVRAWDLDSGEEIDTELPRRKKGGATKLVRMFEFGQDEPRYAFCMADYLKTKPSFCAELAQLDGQSFVLCSGAQGEVRVFDAQRMGEVDLWTINTPRHDSAYIHSLCATVAAGKLWVCAGNEYGGIALHRLGAANSTQPREDAHDGLVNSIVALDGEEPLFASGGEDGIVNIWNTQLALLERIDFGVPVVQLQAMARCELAVTLATGVVRLHLARERLSAAA